MEIRIVTGDITRQDTDAIVNAANSSLLGGGGVDGAIHRAAGPDLLAHCRKLRETTLRDGLPVGKAVATPAGRLPNDWVIHTVGPNWHQGQHEPRLLVSCFRESLDAAVAVGARSVAFPAISAGIYGWDPAEVARIAAETLAAGNPAWEESIEEVRFVLFNPSLTAVFEAAFGVSRA